MVGPCICNNWTVGSGYPSSGVGEEDGGGNLSVNGLWEAHCAL